MSTVPVPELAGLPLAQSRPSLWWSRTALEGGWLFYQNALRCFASTTGCRLWHKADMATAFSDVRFWGKADMVRSGSAIPPKYGRVSNRENFLMPPISLFQIAIVSAIVGVLVLWFGIYLWRDRRDR